MCWFLGWKSLGFSPLVFPTAVAHSSGKWLPWFWELFLVCSNRGWAMGAAVVVFCGWCQKASPTSISLSFYYMSKTLRHLCCSASASLVRGCSGAPMAQAEVMAGRLHFKCCGIHSVGCLLTCLQVIPWSGWHYCKQSKWDLTLKFDRAEEQLPLISHFVFMCNSLVLW